MQKPVIVDYCLDRAGFITASADKYNVFFAGYSFVDLRGASDDRHPAAFCGAANDLAAFALAFRRDGAGIYNIVIAAAVVAADIKAERHEPFGKRRGFILVHAAAERDYSDSFCHFCAISNAFIYSSSPESILTASKSAFDVSDSGSPNARATSLRRYAESPEPKSPSE